MDDIKKLEPIWAGSGGSAGFFLDLLLYNDRDLDVVGPPARVGQGVRSVFLCFEALGVCALDRVAVCVIS